MPRKQRPLAERFWEKVQAVESGCVSKDTIGLIARGKIWKHVTDEQEG